MLSEKELLAKEAKMLAFLKKKILQRLSNDFKSGGKLVTFEEIYAIEKEKVSLGDGVEVMSYEKGTTEDGERYTRLRCWIPAGVSVKNHAHPDYIEIFKTVKGFMIDKTNDIFLKPEDPPYTFGINQWHNILAVPDTLLEIMCIEKKNS